MKVIQPSASVMFFKPENEMTAEQAIEWAGRKCYKSEDKITDDSAEKFIRMIRKRGHHAMLEFGYAMAHVVGDRGNSHEQVRHRLASYAQESTRYCNYGKGKFGSEITVVAQPGIYEGTDEHLTWVNAMQEAERSYLAIVESLKAKGCSAREQAQVARAVLPISLKAEIVVGANLREWRHIFTMRCAEDAHPIIRGIMRGLLFEFTTKMPSVYEDLADRYL